MDTIAHHTLPYHRPPRLIIPYHTSHTTLHTTLHHTNGMIQRYMMMPSPAHCSVEKPHNSSKKILFPGKTTRSANAIRFHCRSLTVSYCIKGKAFLKTHVQTRPFCWTETMTWGQEEVFHQIKVSDTDLTLWCAACRALSTYTYNAMAHTVLHSYSDTYVTLWCTYVTLWCTHVTLWCAACHTVEASPHILSHHYQKPEAGKANFGQKRPQRTLSQCHSRTFLQLSNFTNNYRGNAVSQLSLNTSFFIQNTD